MTDAYTYGTWIARFMGNRATKYEIEQLTQWMNTSDENMELFEYLIEEVHANGARQWFKEAGVNTRFIKWVDSEKFPSEIIAEQRQRRVTWITSVAIVLVAAWMIYANFIKAPTYRPDVVDSPGLNNGPKTAITGDTNDIKESNHQSNK